MRIIPAILGVLVVALLSNTGVARAAADKTDHPLVSAYEGSTVKRKSVTEYDEYNLITGTDTKQFSGPTLEGKITKILYTNPKDRSILEMYRNYTAALKKAGVEILFECDQKKFACIKRYAGPTFQKHSDIHSISNLEGRFLSGKIEQEGKTAFVIVAVGKPFTAIHVVEIEKMDTGMVSVNAEALGEGLDLDGYVIVEGIYFDTDKTTLKSESKTALDEVFKLLEMRTDLNVFVVGHTDMQGSLAHNMTLSKGRAQAVVAALTGHGIDPGRLEGYGVGPLAPQASNQSETGRARNRNVVLVAR